MNPKTDPLPESYLAYLGSDWETKLREDCAYLTGYLTATESIPLTHDTLRAYVDAAGRARRPLDPQDYAGRLYTMLQDVFGI